MLVVTKNNTKTGDAVCLPAAKLYRLPYPWVKGLPPWNYAYASTTTNLLEIRAGLKTNQRKLLENRQNKDEKTNSSNYSHRVSDCQLGPLVTTWSHWIDKGLSAEMPKITIFTLLLAHSHFHSTSEAAFSLCPSTAASRLYLQYIQHCEEAVEPVTWWQTLVI